jgi:serine/threonine protein kinase
MGKQCSDTNTEHLGSPLQKFRPKNRQPMAHTHTHTHMVPSCSDSRSAASTERNSLSLTPRERSAAVLPGCDAERPDVIIDEHPSAVRKLSNSSGNVLTDTKLEHCEVFSIPSSDVEVGAGCDVERPDAIIDERFIRRSSSALRRMSSSSGNVLPNAELDHCEMFSIPSSDVEVGACIGMGACSQVIRGVWRGRSVAIKTIKTCDSTGDDDAAANTSKYTDMVKEIALMCRAFATVSHPNIVGFYGICVDGPQLWLIMEYVGGGSVEDFLATKDSGYKPSRRRALTWALDLAHSLHYLHSQRPAIVHRDIKPANLMLTECREHLKLCDFGVSTTLMLNPCNESRRETQDNICDRESAGYLTDASYNDNAIAPSARPKEMTGRTGTYRYMAPEVFEDQTPYYNSAVDIYSAALSMWVLFHGARPFNNLDGLTVAQLASRQTLRPPLNSMRSTSPVSLGHKKIVPSSVAHLLEVAWHGNPAQRPSASDMVAVLEDALRKEGLGLGKFFQRALSASSGLPSAAEFERAPSASELLIQRRDSDPFPQSPSP